MYSFPGRAPPSVRLATHYRLGWLAEITVSRPGRAVIDIRCAAALMGGHNKTAAVPERFIPSRSWSLLSIAPANGRANDDLENQLEREATPLLFGCQ